MRLGKALLIVVAHVTPYSRSVLTVVRLCMPSMHILNVVLAAGVIVVATSKLARYCVKTVKGSTAWSPSAFAAASFVICPSTVLTPSFSDPLRCATARVPYFATSIR